MEDTWLELGLKGRSDLPMNRGWMNTFRRWVEHRRRSSQLWPLFRPEYGTDFVRFCEEELHMRARPGGVRELLSSRAARDVRRESVDLLAEEFAREWPGEVAVDRDLRTLINRANDLEPRGRPSRLADRPVARAPQAVGQLAGAIRQRDHPAGRVGSIEHGNATRRGLRVLRLGSPAPPRRRAGHRVHRAGSRRGDRAARAATRQQPCSTLRARYPKSGRDGDNDHERCCWLSFFALYDFQPVSPSHDLGRPLLPGRPDDPMNVANRGRGRASPPVYQPARILA